MNKLLKRLSNTPIEVEEITDTNEKNLVIKSFQDLKINIYGTYEEPLFKAKDIGELLDIVKIRDSIKNLDQEDKILMGAGTNGGLQEQYFITENGLYELIFTSRKPIAKEFKKWVKSVIKELRLKGKYDLEEQLKIKDQEAIQYKTQLKLKEDEIKALKDKTYEEVDKSGHVYVLKCDGGIKVGKTKDAVLKRLKSLQTGNVDKIEILMDCYTCNEDLLEKSVHYILSKYRNNINREFFDCDVNYIKMVIEFVNNNINTMKSTYQNIQIEELYNIYNSKLLLIKNKQQNIIKPADAPQIVKDSKSTDNYIYKFLNDVFQVNGVKTYIKYQLYSMEKLEDVRKLYDEYMKNFKTIKYKFNKENIAWNDLGYEIKNLMICKSCMNIANPECCDKYSQKNRTKREYISNLKIISD